MFNTNRIDEARALVLDYHYSGRMPSTITVCATEHVPGGLFGDCGEAVAACIIGHPATRWSQPVLELTRLVRRDDWDGPLTALIAFACKQAKAAGAHLLVSFADATHKHHGGIYQAASWNYHEQRERCMDGLIIDGVYIQGRTCNARFGTRSPGKVGAAMPHVDVRPHYDEGKHLYWRALTKTGRRMADALGFDSRPYPKPDRAP